MVEKSHEPYKKGGNMSKHNLRPKEVDAIQQVLNLDLVVTNPENGKLLKQTYMGFEVGEGDLWTKDYKNIDNALNAFYAELP